MNEPEGNRIESGVKRVLASVVGLVIGLGLGVLVALFVVGFGDAFIVTVALAGLVVAVLAFFKPTPFLAIAGLILSIAGVDDL